MQQLARCGGEKVRKIGLDFFFSSSLLATLLITNSMRENEGMPLRKNAFIAHIHMIIMSCIPLSLASSSGLRVWPFATAINTLFNVVRGHIL